MIDFDTKYAEILELYTQGAHTLQQNNYTINACRCSNDLAQLLLEVDKGTYGYEFAWCLQNSDKLAEFAKARAGDIVAHANNIHL